MLSDEDAAELLLVLREKGHLQSEQPKAVVPQEKKEIKDEDKPLWKIFDEMYASRRRHQ